MKKIKLNSKLILNKEKISILNPKELVNLKGGKLRGTHYSFCDETCDCTAVDICTSSIDPKPDDEIIV